MNAIESRCNTTTAPVPVAAVILVAAVLGLSLGTIDITLAVLSRPYGFSTLPSLYVPLVATALFFFSAYLAAWFAAGRWCLRRTGLAPFAGAVAIAAFVALAFAVGRLDDLLRPPQEGADYLRWSGALALCLVVAAAVYLAVRRIESSDRQSRVAAGLGIAMPFVLMEGLVFAWVQIYATRSVISAPFFLASLALLVAVAITVHVFVRSGRKPRGLVAVAALAGVTAAVPAVSAGYARLSQSAGNAAVEAASGSVRQVVVISVDTLRADALSTYNPDSFATPGIDRLAADGVLFEAPISSAPWTVASLASIMTGLSPTVHGVTEIKSKLPDNVVTLAERMHDAGYRTGAMVLNDLLRPEGNMTQGFDEYIFLTSPSFGNAFGAQLLQRALPAAFPSSFPSTDEITDRALDWFGRHREQSFFFWLHYYDPHAPYTPPARYMHTLEAPPGFSMEFWQQREVLGGVVVPSRLERAWIRALYDGEVRYVDDNIRRLVDGLKELGIYDDALIVFTSDHGEEFWEHGGHGHGHSQYDELLWVPLIFKLPGMQRTGRVARTVGTESVTPTILDIVGVDYERDRLSSPSLSPLLGPGRGTYPEHAVISTAQVLFDRKEAVTRDDFKYIRSTLSDAEEMFDRVGDREERRPLIPQPMAYLEAARAALARHREGSNSLRAHFRIRETEAVELDEETLKRLRALGYIQ